MNDTPRKGPPHRDGFRTFRPILTRWADNDVVGHVNNAMYYNYFDTAVTAWLIDNKLGTIRGAGPMWMVAETGCRYISEVSFPEPLEVGLRVARLGTSSVKWDVALFKQGAAHASADGIFVHVHVSRETRRPVPMPDDMRAVFATILA
jgi:acyl-CoA thioester hydrolase